VGDGPARPRNLSGTFVPGAIGWSAPGRHDGNLRGGPAAKEARTAGPLGRGVAWTSGTQRVSAAGLGISAVPDEGVGWATGGRLARKGRRSPRDIVPQIPGQGPGINLPFWPSRGGTPQWAPTHYTQLSFLDEAVARRGPTGPCAECRRG